MSVYTAPSVKAGKPFLYFEPLHPLSMSTQRRWSEESERTQMIEDAMGKARAHQR